MPGPSDEGFRGSDRPVGVAAGDADGGFGVAGLLEGFARGALESLGGCLAGKVGLLGSDVGAVGAVFDLPSLASFNSPSSTSPRV